MWERPFATRKGILAGRAGVAWLEHRPDYLVRQSGPIIFHIQGYPGCVFLAPALPKRDVNSAHSRHGFSGVLHQIDQDPGQVFARHPYGNGAALGVDR